jgi:RNA polymerase primary sigma factor
MRQLKITNSITERTPITERYLSEVAHIDMISQEREVELAQAIKRGDKQAEHDLIKANLRFVISCAKQYQNRGLSLDDLIAEGNLGLIKAAQRFDETRGFKFISYAVTWIRQAIMDSIQKNSRTVRMPSNKIQQINAIRDITTKLLQENDGNISPDVICQKLGIDMSTYNILMSANASVSMDKKITEDDTKTMHDFMIDENSNLENHISDISMKEQLQIALGCLTEFEKAVIMESYGLNKEGRELSLNELALKFDYSSERIRQIKHKCLQKMKRYLVKKCRMTTIER